MTLRSGGVMLGRVCYKRGYPVLFTRKLPNSQVLGQMVFPQVVHMEADLCSVLLVGPLVLVPELSPVKCSEFRELFRSINKHLTKKAKENPAADSCTCCNFGDLMRGIEKHMKAIQYYTQWPQPCECSDHCNQCGMVFQLCSSNVYVACGHVSSFHVHKIVLYLDSSNFWLGFS